MYFWRKSVKGVSHSGEKMISKSYYYNRVDECEKIIGDINIKIEVLECKKVIANIEKTNFI